MVTQILYPQTCDSILKKKCFYTSELMYQIRHFWYMNIQRILRQFSKNEMRSFSPSFVLTENSLSWNISIKCYDLIGLNNLIQTTKFINNDTNLVNTGTLLLNLYCQCSQNSLLFTKICVFKSSSWFEKSFYIQANFSVGRVYMVPTCTLTQTNTVFCHVFLARFSMQILPIIQKLIIEIPCST